MPDNHLPPAATTADSDMRMIDPSLPLIDLHRHLDGSVRIETVLELGLQHGLPLPAQDLEGLRPYVQVVEPVPSLVAFLAKFEWMTGVLVDADACRRVAYENVQDGAAEGLDYLELRFSPIFMAEPHGLDPALVVEAVADGVAAGVRDTGLPVKLIGILSRTYGVQSAWRELAALMAHRDKLVAIDLAGDEAGWPGELFEAHFEAARRVDWHVTVHAGEAAGAGSVRHAIRRLGATRIGHGVRAIEDPELLDEMARRGIGIESSLTSNLQTSSVASLDAHPLRAFLARGLLATINTDDPGISGIDLRYEFEVAAPKAGITPQAARQAQVNALQIAFLGADERRLLLARAAERAGAHELGQPQSARTDSPR